MKAIINYNLQVLDQLKELLVQLDNEAFTASIHLLYNSSLGKHTRHIIEFYISFFAAFQTQSVDYDKRKRDYKLENDLFFVIENIILIKEQLKKIVGDSTWQITSEMQDNLGTHKGSTTCSRELNYLADHTVHHLALLKIGINLLQPDLVLDENFGVAASTINSRK